MPGKRERQKMVYLACRLPIIIDIDKYEERLRIDIVFSSKRRQVPHPVQKRLYTTLLAGTIIFRGLASLSKIHPRFFSSVGSAGQCCLRPSGRTTPTALQTGFWNGVGNRCKDVRNIRSGLSTCLKEQQAFLVGICLCFSCR